MMALLAAEWVRRGRAVTLITLGDADDFYSLPSEVERVALDLLKPSRGAVDALRNNWRRLRELRRAILQRQPHTVISFMDATNILTLLALRQTAVPVIVSERIDPRYYPIGRGWVWLRRRLYPRAHAVVVQTSAVADWAREFVPDYKVHIIANPIAPPPLEEVAASPRPCWLPDAPYIAAMGRLDPQKGFDLLLTAFAQLVETAQWPDLNLVIMGEGAERSALQNLARNLGISDKVIMPGRIANAWPVLAACECFVLSSRFEGFPNALLEAMAMGAPTVSFDCPSGPSDIVNDGADGLLVKNNDTKALVDTITKLFANPELAQQLRNAAPQSMQRYSVKAITDQWENVE